MGTRAAIYARQSKDRLKGIKAQVADCTGLCWAREWGIVVTLTDNDLSASNGKARPGYDQLTAMIRARQVDVVVVSHIDRLLRKLSDLEALIDLALEAGVTIAAVTGDIDLSNDAGRLVGRMLAVIARGEMERKSARQQRANRQAAEDGKARKATPRPFGWLDDRVTADPLEGPAVADACRALLAGGTISGVCRDWTARGVRPAQSNGAWNRASVTTILRNPRIAGISVYKGSEVGQGEWDALVPEETYRAVVRLLSDPGRKPSKGVRTMLGGLASCHCGNHVTGSLNQLGQHIYRCNPSTRAGRPGPHATVRCEPVDKAIGALVVARLRKPDAVDLLAPKVSVDVKALRDEATGIRSRMDGLVDDCVLGKVTEKQRDHGLDVGSARLAEIEADLAEAGRESVLAPLVAAENVAAAWEALPTDRRRAVVDALMTVTLHPAGRGARVIDPSKVIGIEWRQQ